MTRAARAMVAACAISAAMLPAAPPASALLTLSVTTKSANDVTATGATLRAEVLVSVLGANVTFQYGPTTSYGTTTMSASTALLGLSQVLSVPVSDLNPSTTYHVRAVASSALSVVYGRDITFVTAAPGAPPAPDDHGGAAPADPAPAADPASTPAAPPSGSSGPAPAGSGSGSGSTGRKPAADGSSGARSPAGDSSPSGGAGPADDATAPRPTLGRTVAAEAVSGTVTVTAPSGQPVDLSAAAALPSGSMIDTRNGTVELTSAVDRKGTTQTGRFWGGVFVVRQSASAKGLTQLVLRGGDFSSCRANGSPAPGSPAHAAAAKKPPRALWGSDDRGRFQTRGRGSVATVRGTRWFTEDRCDGTVTRVVQGAVAVYDLRRRQTVLVTRGHRYLARVNR